MSGPPLLVFGYRLPFELASAWQRLVGGPVDPRAAIPAFERLLLASPGFVPARIKFGQALMAAGRYRDAHAQALLVASEDVKDPALVAEQLAFLRLFQEIEAMEAVVQRLDARQCPPDLLVRIASELAPAALYDEAGRLLEVAGSREPLPAAGTVLRGTLEMTAGEKAAAQASFTHALRSEDVSPAHVMWLQSLLPASPAQQLARAAELRSLLSRSVSEGQDAVYAGHAFHNVLHALGQHDEAWEALQAALSARRRLDPYDRNAQHAIFDALTSTSPLPEARFAAQSMPGCLFIVGMHRSGTSVLERMLLAHGDVADGGESYVFPAAIRHAVDRPGKNPLDLAMVLRARDADLSSAGDIFRKYASWRARGKRLFTEKLPSNFLHVGHILRALPDARILHMRRDPMDTCFSNLRTLFMGAAAHTSEQRDLADYFNRYAALMEHWHAVAPGRILDVDYESLVEDPEPLMRAVATFCGLEFRASMLSPAAARGHVATASINTVREGLLRGRGAQWKAYAAHLGPLRQGLRGASS